MSLNKYHKTRIVENGDCLNGVAWSDSNGMQKKVLKHQGSGTISQEQKKAGSALLFFSTLCNEKLLKLLEATQWRSYGIDKTRLSDPKFDN